MAVALSGFAGCFEPPVVELLTLDFAPDGAAVATLEVTLAGPAERESRAVERRIDDRQRALLDGVDPWLDRFAALAAAEDGAEWRRQGERLRSFRRWARLGDPAGLDELFQNDAVSLSYDRDDDRATLELVPTGTSRATRKERLRVERDIDTWAAAYADYLAATFALDAYLETHPGRAELCWRSALGGEGLESELSPEESQRIEAVADSMVAATAAFEIDPAEGYSLDERVRQALHPLAARLAVQLPVEAEEVAGFARADERVYVVPELALWDAAERLEGRWLAADPLHAWAVSLRSGGSQEIDVTPFAAAPIALGDSPPSAAEVASALRAELTPPTLYRLSWRPSRAEPGSEGGE